jgi:small subunit ribosomal protein S6
LREYETVFVLHPTLDEKEVEAEIQAVQELITSGKGVVKDVERWGRRRLAYQIRKVHEGTYTLIRFESEPQVLRDLERRYRLNEKLLRHMTLLAEGPPAPPRAEPEGDFRDRRRDEADFELPRRGFDRRPPTPEVSRSAEGKVRAAEGQPAPALGGAPAAEAGSRGAGGPEGTPEAPAQPE